MLVGGRISIASVRPPLVLGYHGIANVDPRQDPVRLFVSPERFRRQVRKLIDRGYEFVRMSEFGQRLHAGGDLSGVCAVTFDDGTLDIVETAAPVLAELGVNGTVYVCPGLFGDAYPWVAPEAGVRLMDAGEVRALADEGTVEIGAHTNEHTVLGAASAELAYAEMAACKQRIEELLGREVPSFCYPRCVYSPPCPAAARRAGYTTAVTCGPRGSWDPFELKRESLHTPDGPVTFALKSRGLYYGTRDMAPARALRRVTRPFRHRGERIG